MMSAHALVQRWLPVSHFRERHSVAMAGDPAAILDILTQLEVEGDRVIRTLLRLREAPSRLWAALGGHSGLRQRPGFSLADFILLERNEAGLAYGLVGRFWRHDFGLYPVSSPEDFRHAAAPGCARLVMVYAVEQDTPGQQKLTTETHVFCPDRRSRLLFSVYWVMIRLGSGFIRRRILARVRRRLLETRA